MIERSHLEILRAVDEAGSLTAAADTLHLTQSALSHSVRKLEAALGIRIWHRDGRRLRLTQAGEYLLELARRVLPQLEHAETVVAGFARGQQGILRIGMECHPCYQWLLKVVEPYLARWPDVDVDVKQKFRFGGIGALLGHEIDLLVTPDPVEQPGLAFTPVFDYELVLVVAATHPLAGRTWVAPPQLARETLITYPVPTARLDIFTRFFQPARTGPARHKVIESTDIMLQMVAAGRGVTALPGWLVDEYSRTLPVVPVRLGPQGLGKQIFLGLREQDRGVAYLEAFMSLARNVRWDQKLALNCAQNSRGTPNMSDIPADLKYIETHQWVRVHDDGTATVGITDFAQEQLGDLVYIGMPEPGTMVRGGEEAGVAESVKSASDVFSPVSGEVIAINEVLEDEPERVNADPYGDGWMFRVRLSDPGELDGLMDAATYAEHVAAQG